MTKEFRKDKVIFVTGSSKGLGKQTALVLAKQGAKVIINGRDKKTLHEVINEVENENIHIIAMQGDVTDPHQCQDIIQSIIKTYKKLDCIINNVGYMARGPLETATIDTIQSSINTNLMSAIYCSKYAIPYLKETHGSIVFVSSLGGIRGIPQISTYSAAKMGVKALSQSLECELRKHHIHCGVVFPGYIQGYENKTIETNTGQTIPAPKEARHKPETVAKNIAKLIKKRKKSIIIGRRSKGFAILNIIAPSLLAWIINKMIPKNITHVTNTNQDND